MPAPAARRWCHCALSFVIGARLLLDNLWVTLVLALVAFAAAGSALALQGEEE